MEGRDRRRANPLCPWGSSKTCGAKGPTRWGRAPSSLLHRGAVLRRNRLQRSRHHADLPDDGDEVRVPVPARNEVRVQVIGHARARGAALVDPGVDTLRVKGDLYLFVSDIYEF